MMIVGVIDEDILVEWTLKIQTKACVCAFAFPICCCMPSLFFTSREKEKKNEANYNNCVFSAW